MSKSRWVQQSTIYDALLADLPDDFTTDQTCSWWPDKWNSVVYKTACLVHDYLYNEARISFKYHKLGRKRSDKILAYAVARQFKLQGKSTLMAGVMYRGLRMFGGIAWNSNGKRLKKDNQFLWYVYHGEGRAPG